MGNEKTIDSMQGKSQVFNPPEKLSKNAWVKSLDEYKEIYQRSIDDPEGFWAERAEESLDWYKKWDKVREYDFVKANIKWFEGAQLNVTYNCLDRHIEKRGDKTAIIWEGDNPDEQKHISYKELLDKVKKCANVLKNNGIKKGDVVAIYMGMIPELAVAMLACARIGAAHNIIFGGFSAESLKDRMTDSKTVAVLTADEAYRGGKTINLKNAVDEAVNQCPSVKRVIVVKRSGGDVAWSEGRDVWWHDEMEKATQSFFANWKKTLSRHHVDTIEVRTGEPYTSQLLTFFKS